MFFVSFSSFTKCENQRRNLNKLRENKNHTSNIDDYQKRESYKYIIRLLENFFYARNKCSESLVVSFMSNNRPKGWTTHFCFPFILLAIYSFRCQKGNRLHQ